MITFELNSESSERPDLDLENKLSLNEQPFSKSKMVLISLDETKEEEKEA